MPVARQQRAPVVQQQDEIRCAQALAADGIELTLMGRNLESVARTAETLPNARAIVIDVTNAASVRNAFGEAGNVDILINNAGAAESAPFERTDEALWQRMLEVNLSGAYRCSQAVLPSMRERQFGRIVNVSSTAGLKGYAYVTAYCAAKHGLVGLTRALAAETGRYGITVNAVCPGFTETDLLTASLDKIKSATGLSEEEARKRLLEGNDQMRFVQPEEIAAKVAWLCSDSASEVSGETFILDGGAVEA